MMKNQASPPPAVRTASLLWLAAVAAGGFETLLALTDLLRQGDASTTEIVTGVGIRVVVFLLATWLAVRLRSGANWARLTLAVLLGVLGTLSLVVDPVRWLVEGNSLSAAIAGAGPLALTFAGSRILHVGFVIAAMVLMFQPAANSYFRRSARQVTVAPGGGGAPVTAARR
ncbi:hypothetical protein [Plantactinospora sp. GCM10030261]|uniref:hypothetical protein n=1 Tax=Plantactinospora sp. GCM10030261 TaxID=3273420 RepID=UPI00360BB398